MMQELDSALKLHAQATANRLRMIQIDFADEDAKVKNDYLCDTIEHALASIIPEKQKLFLAALQERFPVCATEGSNSATGQGDSSPATDSGFASPQTLVTALIGRFSKLPEEQRVQMTRRLEEAGIIAVRPSPQNNFPTGLSLNQDLKDIDPEKLVQAFFMLLECVSALEPLVVEMWRTLSHQNGNKSPKKIKAMVERYLTSQASASDAEVLRELKSLQRLITAMIASISQVGKQFGKKFVTTFSPRDIAATVKLEGGSFLVSNEVKCWKKYEKLADSWTEDVIEEEIRKVMVEYVNKILGQSA